MPSASLAIFLESEDELLTDTAKHLKEQFQRLGTFQEIQVVPFNHQISAGELLPDLFMSVNRGARSIETKDHQKPSHQFESTFYVSVGDRAGRSSQSWSGTFSPPILQFRMEGEITVTLTMKQSWQRMWASIGSGKWTPEISRALAEKLAEECNKQLLQLKDKETPLEDLVLPAEFFPEYEPAPDWPWLKEFGAVKLLDGRRFMVSNQTVWKIPKPVDQQKLIERFEEHFPEKNVAGNPGANQKIRFIHRTNYGETAIEVFSERDGIWTSGEKDEPKNYYVVWTHSLGEKEIRESLNQLLERNPTEEELATVSFCWFLNWEGVNRYFDEHPPQLFLSMENLANDKSRPDRKELILKANSLALIQMNSPNLNRLKSNAKDAGMGELPKTPDMSLLVPDHLLDLTAEVVPEVTLRDHVPQLFYAGEGEDRTHIFQIRSLPQANQQERVQWERTQIDLLKNGRTTSTITGAWETCPVTLSVVGQRGFREMNVKPTDTPNQYKLTFGPIQMHSTEMTAPPPSTSENPNANNQSSNNQSSEEK